MENHLGDPIWRRVGGLAAPDSTNVCISGSAMQKRSTAGLPKAKKSVQDMKNTEKPAQKEPKRDPAQKKGPLNLREATKTQQSIITERRALRKHKTGLKKTREGTTNDNQSDNTTSDSPDACASQFAKKQRLPPQKHCRFNHVPTKQNGCQVHKTVCTLIPSRWGAFL